MINFNHNSIKFFEKIILSFSYIFDFFKNENTIRILVYHHVEKKILKILPISLRS